MGKYPIHQSLVVVGLAALALAGAAGVAGAAQSGRGYGTRTRHIRRTFRQRAIIDKLTRVLNDLPAGPDLPPNGNAGPTLLQLPLTARSGRRCSARS